MHQSRQAIERELRRRICSGIYAPGSHLPPRRQLLQELGVSPQTLQRAMDRLTEQGFIEVQGTQRTRVAEHLPNEGTIALLFPTDAKHAVANRFWAALLRATESWDRGMGLNFRPYFLSDRHLDIPEHRRLCTDLADGGLAGVVSVIPPFWLAGSPVLSADIPRVALGGNDPAQYGCSCVTIGDNGVEFTVLRRFREQGRRRLAVLASPADEEPPWLSGVRELGLDIHPAWSIALSPHTAESARPVARLLCSWPGSQRPDCMLITDDNLVPHATAGILDAGLDLPRDLAVGAHANFPYPTHAAFRCMRFGVDIIAMLQAASAEIRRLADGAPPRVVSVDRVCQP